MVLPTSGVAVYGRRNSGAEVIGPRGAPRRGPPGDAAFISQRVMPRLRTRILRWRLAPLGRGRSDEVRVQQTQNRAPVLRNLRYSVFCDGDPSQERGKDGGDQCEVRRRHRPRLSQGEESRWQEPLTRCRRENQPGTIGYELPDSQITRFRQRG